MKIEIQINNKPWIKFLEYGQIICDVEGQKADVKYRLLDALDEETKMAWLEMSEESYLLWLQDLPYIEEWLLIELGATKVEDGYLVE